MRNFFTLLEILVATFIVMVIFAAIIAVFANIRGTVRFAEDVFEGALLAESNLNALFSEVREDTWDSGALSLGSYDLGSLGKYSLSYNVEPVTVTGQECRKVTFNISW
ncbi:MAG: hypothetical protein DRP76_01540 [Candidatus Omnitrophota bacterium]|nr:MAG: hypothetical protein DRP76_01540 [Candidatus Omnitrophota bacterium]